MTTIVILLLGGGAVLIMSAIESTPNGDDVSVFQTISDIWNDTLSFKQPTGQGSSTQTQGYQPQQQQQQTGTPMGNFPQTLHSASDMNDYWHAQRSLAVQQWITEHYGVVR